MKRQCGDIHNFLSTEIVGRFYSLVKKDAKLLMVRKVSQRASARFRAGDMIILFDFCKLENNVCSLVAIVVECLVSINFPVIHIAPTRAHIHIRTSFGENWTRQLSWPVSPAYVHEIYYSTAAGALFVSVSVLRLIVVVVVASSHWMNWCLIYIFVVHGYNRTQGHFFHAISISVILTRTHSAHTHEPPRRA